MRVGFVGAGAAARALAAALHAGGGHGGSLFEVVGYVRSRPRARAAFPGRPRRAASAAALARSCDLLILAVPDRAIAAAAQQAAPGVKAGAVVIHLSGAKAREVLISCARRGAHTAAFHPLQTFPGGPHDGARVRGAFVSIDAAPAARALLVAFARALGMHPIALSSGDRALYHASAALASNGVVALVDLAVTIFARATGAPRAKAFAALTPLFVAAAENLRSLGPEASLSGPVSRGDAPTVEAHLLALGAIPDGAREIYRLLSERAVDVALRKGTLTPRTAAPLRRLLADCAPLARRQGA